MWSTWCRHQPVNGQFFRNRGISHRKENSHIFTYAKGSLGFNYRASTHNKHQKVDPQFCLSRADLICLPQIVGFCGYIIKLQNLRTSLSKKGSSGDGRPEGRNGDQELCKLHFSGYKHHRTRLYLQDHVCNQQQPMHAYVQNTHIIQQQTAIIFH